MTKICLYLFFLFLVFTGYSPVSFGQQEDAEFKMKFDSKTQTMQPVNVAIVEFMRGKATVTDNKTKKIQELTEKSKIAKNSTVRTLEKTFVKLKTVDMTFISIGPNSVFEFSKYVHAKADKRTSVLKLIKGKIRANYTRPADPQKNRFETPSVAMGVRGTEFLSNVIGPADRPKTQVALLSGALKVDVSALHIPKITRIDMRPGDLLDSDYLIEKQEAFLFQMEKKDQDYLDGQNMNKGSKMKPFLNFDLPHFEKRQIKEKLVHKTESLNKSSSSNVGVQTSEGSWEKIIHKQIHTPSNKRAVTPQEYNRSKNANKNFDRKPKNRPRCRYKKECVEFKMQQVGGKKVELCSKEVTTVFPRGCVK